MARATIVRAFTLLQGRNEHDIQSESPLRASMASQKLRVQPNTRPSLNPEHRLWRPGHQHHPQRTHHGAWMSAAARRAPGVLEILTSANAPKLPQGGKAAVKPPAGRVLSLLQDDLVHYNNQPIAVVIAESLEQALFTRDHCSSALSRAAASSISKPASPRLIPVDTAKIPRDVSAGKATPGMAEADVKIDQIYHDARCRLTIPWSRTPPSRSGMERSSRCMMRRNTFPA